MEQSVELPGASSITAWEESWRIFRTAAIMLNLASSAVLDRYASEFKQRVAEYPDCWHIAAQADIRCEVNGGPLNYVGKRSFIRHTRAGQISTHYNRGMALLNRQQAVQSSGIVSLKSRRCCTR